MIYILFLHIVNILCSHTIKTSRIFSITHWHMQWYEVDAGNKQCLDILLRYCYRFGYLYILSCICFPFCRAWNQNRILLHKVCINLFILHLQAIQKIVDTNSASTLQQGKFSFFSGPKAKTVSTFWKMVWEQNSSVIVMLTNLKEKEKVQKYFPLAY